MLSRRKAFSPTNRIAVGRNGPDEGGNALLGGMVAQEVWGSDVCDSSVGYLDVEIR